MIVGLKALSCPDGILVELGTIVPSFLLLDIINPVGLGACPLQRVVSSIMASRGDEMGGDMIGIKTPCLEVMCWVPETIGRLWPIMNVFRDGWEGPEGAIGGTRERIVIFLFHLDLVE